MSAKPKLKLTGQDGNAFVIIGLARRASVKADWTPCQWAEYKDKATAGDYDHLLRVTMDYFDVI